MTSLSKLRVIYRAALLITLAVAAWGGRFGDPAIFCGGFGGCRSSAGSELSSKVAFAASLFVIVAPMAFLAARPMGWGKMLLLFVAFSWVAHGTTAVAMGWTSPEHLTPVFLAAGVLGILGVAHQVIDPALIGRRDS
jgi:hypothetical protein